MQIQISAATAAGLTPEMRRCVDRHVRLALSRFGNQVRSVRVVLTAVAPRNNIGCQIVVQTKPCHDVVIEHRDSSLMALIPPAMERVQRAVERRFKYAELLGRAAAAPARRSTEQKTRHKKGDGRKCPA
jgi:hypothetical protein